MEDAPSPFYADLFTESGALKHLLNGVWRVSASGELTQISNPSKGGVAYRVQACTVTDVDAAYDGAAAAQLGWAKTPLHARCTLLHKAAALMREHKAPIARCLVNEVAKPAKDALTEVVRSADLIDYTAEEGIRLLCEGKLLTSDAFPGNDRTKLCMVSKVALGVVLCIPPFNYPVNLAVSKIGPALIAGNAVVLKPPTQGCASALHMVQCFAAAGLPAGLLNVVTGNVSSFGDHLTTHPKANCISFTGGDTGLGVCRKAGMVPLQMELGGKDAAIVLPDADLALAAAAVVKGGFSYSGQRCTAVKLVLAHEAVADALVARCAPAVAALRVGQPEEDADICAVVSARSADFIQGLVEDALGKGAVALQPWRREGNLIWPMLLDRVTEEMRIAWEEPFGPVVPVMRVASAAAAVELVNRSRFGLQGCVFTQDISAAIAVSDAMRTGTVQINAPPARGPDHFPFQGVKDSGIGSQGITNSILMMTKLKTVVINLPAASYALA